MSAYDNVVGGKLRLKGKALDVKAGGVKKKKKKEKRHHDDDSEIGKHEGESAGNVDYHAEDLNEEAEKLAEKKHTPSCDDHLTPAERRYIEQKESIDRQRLAKTSNKSHRDRIQDFNQYLANMSEHYDIPKVGPG